MSRDDAWLLDMLTHSREARERVAGITRDEFLLDRDKQLAVTHLVMIVGEAAAQVAVERRALLPEVPWGKVVSTRNRTIHHYFKVDAEIIWDVVDSDLPELIRRLEAEIPPDDKVTD